MDHTLFRKRPNNTGYIKNMEVVGFHDADQHYLFQTQLYKTADGKFYLYGGCYKGNGVEIIDVTDPANPTTIKYLDVMDSAVYPYMATPKVQICDDLMIVATGNCMDFLHGPAPEKYEVVRGGVSIYSLKEDPKNPKFLSFWDTGVDDASAQVHRFTYNGGRYLHLTATCTGFIDLIYRIVDIKDPANPKEVGRWWNPGQFIGNQTKKTREREFCGWNGSSTYPGFVHFVYATGDRAYLSCAGAGFKILDISNPKVPQVIGELKMTPPFSGKFGGALCHTFMPLTGRKYAVGFQEGERFWIMNRELQDAIGTEPMNGIEMIDISDETDPVMISIFPYPEVPEDFPYENFNYCGLPKPGPFGPHNIHEPMSGKPWIEDNPNRIYNCYFHAGVRVYDVTDPFVPKEIAYFIPPNPEELYFDVPMANEPLGTTEDIIVDDRGYIYVNTMHDGVYILKCLV